MSKWLLALAVAGACCAESFDMGVLFWGSAQVPVKIPAAADYGRNGPPGTTPSDIGTVEISVERQPVEALDAFTGSRPAGMGLYLITVCGCGPGARRISVGQVRQALAEEGVSITTEMITRQVLVRTRKRGMSYLSRGGQILELIGPGVLAATGSGAIKLRPRELAGLAAAVTMGRVVVDVSREERERARDPLGERQDPWFWQLPKTIELAAGDCTDTVQGLGKYTPGSRAVFTFRTTRGN